MQEVVELTYKNLSYWDGETKAICAKALGTNCKRIRLTTSREPMMWGGYHEVSMLKTADSWQWSAPLTKYPLIVYERTKQTLDTFFPDAQVGDVKSVWLSVEVLEA
jgi:hypothetical protein